MRKTVCVFIAAIICFCSFALSETSRLYEGDLVASSCVLMDAHTGEILFSKNPDTKRYPASTTKIMTLLISIEKCDGRTIVTVPACASQISTDSTRVPVYPGEVMPLKDLWYGLIYNSGNDAANAIAYITSGSIDAFVEEMNAKATELGMTHTHFVNAHGLHRTEHYTTARDMATLTYYALDNDLFREITFSTSYTMQPTALRDELVLYHDYSILNFASQYYYPYARGIKTGYTSNAGQCFVGAAQKDGNELIAVIMLSGYNKPQKWEDAKKMFEYGFAVLKSRQTVQ